MTQSISSPFEIIKEWPHDTTAFTEGLVYHSPYLYESAGGDQSTPNIGLSSIRRTSLRNSRAPSKKVLVDKQYFAEGLTILGEKIFQLTYTSHIGFIYRLDDITRIGEFHYEGAGWGLTNDGKRLIMSDGTDVLRFLDPVSFKLVDTVALLEGQRPLRELNELEYAAGKIYGNVYNQDRIVIIDPSTGQVLRSIDMAEIAKPFEHVGVLNGIAYDEEDNRWFVTGKNWPKLFELQFK